MPAYDFTLTLVREGHDYLVYAESELAGEAGPISFDGMKIAYFGAATLRLDEAIEADERWTAHEIGAELYETIFRAEIEKLFLKACTVAKERNADLRLVVKARHAPEIHEIPWELLQARGSFLSLSPKTPVVRYLAQAEPVQRAQIEPPLRVLLTTACPRDEESFDYKGEERTLRHALAPLGDRANLTVMHQASAESLRHQLIRAQNLDRPFHVWHHAGHGQVTQQIHFILGLTNSRGTLQRTRVEHLAPVLRACYDLRIAVLNVCQGASVPGLATAMAQLNVPGVIGFRSSIFDHSALKFAECFYRGLVEMPFESAATLARLALIQSGEHPLDWAQVLVFARTLDTRPMIAEAREPEKTAKGRTVIRVGGEDNVIDDLSTFGTVTVGGREAAPTEDVEIVFDPRRLRAGKVVQVGKLHLPAHEVEGYARDLLAFLRNR